MTDLTNEILERALGQHQGNGATSAMVLHESAPPLSLRNKRA
jgi:hypothetical protein